MLKSCWISPSGTIHTVKSHGHAEFARKKLNLPSRYGVHESILALAQIGWLHIGPSEFISTIPYTALPESQYTVLHQLAIEFKDTLIGDAIISYICS